MKRLAFAAFLAGACALTACGGDDDDDGIDVPDAGGDPDAPPSGLCDPVNQTDCPAGQKCAHLNITETLGMTACVPNGTVALGEPCEFGPVGETTGYDNCESTEDVGAQCLNGLCREICSTTPDSCSKGFSCSTFEDLFEDTEGVCSETCDPIAQDCAVEDEGCYLDLGDLEGQATCVGIPLESEALSQGMECHGPDAESCYLNGCAEGFHPTVVDVPPDGGKSLCTSYCQPVDTYVDDPNGDWDGTAKTGATVGRGEGFDDDDPKTPAVDCSGARIGAAGHQCRFFQSLFDLNDNQLDYIPATYGFCVDTTAENLEFFGDCQNTSYEREFRAFDVGFPPKKGAEPEVGQEGVTNYCDAPAAEGFPDEGRCGSLCTSVAKFTEIGDAYCKEFPDGMLCAGSLTRRRQEMMKIYLGRPARPIRALAQ